MKISEIRDILKAELLTGGHQLDLSVVGGGGADFMVDILAAVAEGSVLLTGDTREEALRTAKVAGVGAVVYVRGKAPSAKTVELGKSYEIPLLKTRYSMFVSCGRLYMNGLRGLDGSW